MHPDDLDELDVVSAIWILASNDENHLLTFEGIRDRLGLSVDEVRSLVGKRRELFRPGAPPGDLDQWKTDMHAGRRLPAWIRQVQDPAGRQKAIDGLTAADVFRSQFRVKRGAPESPIPVLTWGLEHLDRLRKSRIAAREAIAKSWQMWLVFGVGVANILVSIGLAVLRGR